MSYRHSTADFDCLPLLGRGGSFNKIVAFLEYPDNGNTDIICPGSSDVICVTDVCEIQLYDLLRCSLLNRLNGMQR